MADEKIVVAIVVGLGSGLIGAYVGNTTIRRIQDQIHQEEIEEAEKEGYKRGYDELATNPARLRKLLTKLTDQE